MTQFFNWFADKQSISETEGKRNKFNKKNMNLARLANASITRHAKTNVQSHFTRDAAMEAMDHFRRRAPPVWSCICCRKVFALYREFVEHFEANDALVCPHVESDNSRMMDSYQGTIKSVYNINHCR